MPVAAVAAKIMAAAQRQLAHGRYAPSTLYGDGHVSEQIADALARLTPYVQKHLRYIEDIGEPAGVRDKLPKEQVIMSYLDSRVEAIPDVQ